MSVFPDIKPILSLNFLQQLNPAHPGYSYARASQAIHRSKTGYAVTYRSGVAACEHDEDGIALGMPVEPATTARGLHCRDLTQSAWACTGCTPAKDAVGLDGVTDSASSLTATTADATCLQSVTLASGQRCMSVDIRRRTGTGAISITLDGGSTWVDITANLSTTKYYRSYTTGVVTNPQFGIKIATSGDAVEVDYCGVEDRAFPTSRILTTTAAVTRASDVASFNLTKLLDAAGNPLWNGTEGTIVVDFYRESPVSSGTYPTSVSIDSNVNSANRIATLLRSDGSVRTNIGVSGVYTDTAVFNGITLPSRVKSVVAFADYNHASSINGLNAVINASVPMPSPLTTLRLADDFYTTYSFIFRSIQLYNRRIADAYLPGLSTL